MQEFPGLPLAEMIEQIQQANKSELDAMIQAIVQRYQVLFPQWEIVSLSLPKHDSKERQQILEMATKLLKK